MKEKGGEVAKRWSEFTSEAEMKRLLEAAEEQTIAGFSGPSAPHVHGPNCNHSHSHDHHHHNHNHPEAAAKAGDHGHSHNHGSGGHVHGPNCKH